MYAHIVPNSTQFILVEEFLINQSISISFLINRRCITLSNTVIEEFAEAIIYSDWLEMFIFGCAT